MPTDGVVPAFKLELTSEVTDQFLEACADIVRRGVLTLGPYTAEFERTLCALAQVRHAVAVTSGTTALELSLRSLGLVGSKILVPTNTNAATAAAVVNTGNVVSFYDAGLCARVEDVEAAMDDATRAVIIVHIGGHISADIDRIVELCAQRSVPLIEDAAHAHGSTRYGRPAGSFGRVAAFSFFPTKVITTGEGGMVTTDDPDLANNVRRLRNQGRLPGEAPRLVGGSYRLNEFGAALGLAQLATLEKWRAAQFELFAAYDEVLAELDWASPVESAPDSVPSGYKYVALAASGMIRDSLVEHCKARGVVLAGGVYVDMLHCDPLFASAASRTDGDFPAADDFTSRHFCLPAWPGLEVPARAKVIDALRAFSTP